MLAGELAHGGAGVVLVERRHAHYTVWRDFTLHARTMEILDSRALLGEFGDPPQETRGHFGGLPLDLTLPTSHPGQWKVPQTRTEVILQEWALSLGARLKCKHEVTALQDTGEAVQVHATGSDGTPLRLRCRYLIACDGEDSTVRRLTGAPFPGHSATRELLRADVAGIDVPARRFQRLEHGLAIAARRPDGVTRVMVHEFGSTAQHRPGGDVSFEEITAVWKRVTGEDISS
ncbi:FAD-dependent monooxygenase, partial [Streptomyces sp. NPDC056626]|uniref:FAD-dependent monooxygenase n=1 Tax=Streptomyces sp. NPDC056626 TaxID=3345880 RepID=UPI003684D1FC